ncbi:MAG: cytochrome b [Emcibacter sp.]|nr:cytochrome b [Emcibacter sp.]
MALKNTETSYGSLAKAFHWGMFILLAGLVILGNYMHGLPADTPDQMSYKFGLYDLHKSFGIMVLFLVVLRLIWRKMNPVPVMPDTMSKIENISAHAMHMLLYAIMFLQPIFGWLMSSYGGHPVKFFGLELPALVGQNKEIGELFEEIHEVTAGLLVTAFVVHVAAALYHHFVCKDDVMDRMSLRPKKSE